MLNNILIICLSTLSSIVFFLWGKHYGEQHWISQCVSDYDDEDFDEDFEYEYEEEKEVEGESVDYLMGFMDGVKSIENSVQKAKNTTKKQIKN